FFLVAPDPPARPAIDGPSTVAGTRDIEDSIDDNRYGLKLSDGAGLKRPLHGELRRIGWSDLRQWTMTLSGVISRIGQPPGWVLESIQQLLRRDFLAGGESARDKNSGQGAKSNTSSELKSHDPSSHCPRSVLR